VAGDELGIDVGVAAARLASGHAGHFLSPVNLLDEVPDEHESLEESRPGAHVAPVELAKAADEGLKVRGGDGLGRLEHRRYEIDVIAERAPVFAPLDIEPAGIVEL